MNQLNIDTSFHSEPKKHLSSRGMGRKGRRLFNALVPDQHLVLPHRSLDIEFI